ncbi:putative oxidoreductase [Trypanosoma grayi]|uniref:putative oxidoreductase n=1 Tax=Trypanosoma grayi TaxID=71804 RepID=UPI0004F47681|nr:putative oxidoreductase [Trypanosoma grayi]KEG13094.1 putative oxidoreductase [Trypanosoma grayi]
MQELKAQGKYPGEEGEEDDDDNDEEGDSDESESSLSENNCKPRDYIGCVVVKYVEALENEDLGITPLMAVSKILDRFSSIRDVHLVRSSSSSSTNGDATDEGQAVHVIDLLLENNGESEKMTAPMLPSPGDTVEILVPNDNDTSSSGRVGEVEKLCSRLGVSPDQWCELHRSPFVPPDHFPPWLPLRRRIQIRTLFAYFVDINSSGYLLRPTFFQTLLRIATSSKDTQFAADTTGKDLGSIELLETCASKEVAPFVYKTVMNNGAPLCYPRLIDMLDIFPFIRLPIARLLEVSGPLRPRKFSVVDYTTRDSSAGTCLRSVQLCLRSVDITEKKRSGDTGGEKKSDAVHVLAGLLRDAASRRQSINGSPGHVFTGHASHPLCNFSSRPHKIPMYAGTKLFDTTPFAKGLKGALLRLATQPMTTAATFPAMILVGAGTGIAPLVSVVHELLRQRQAGMWSEVKNPGCWVIYGARNLAELVFHKQLQEALKLNVISRYDVALSRSNEQVYPKYVTDVLDSHADVLRSALLENDAQLFVCGPVTVLRSLRRRLMDHILASSDDDESMREQRVLLLEKKGQLMFDVWGTVNVFE